MQGLEGFQTILSKRNWRCYGTIKDRSMDADITYFIQNSDDWVHASTSLLWLEIDFNRDIYMTCIPSWIPLQNLQYLSIAKRNLRKLRQTDAQGPSSLKELENKHTNLEEFPDLSRTSNHLEKVVLNDYEIPIEWLSFLESLKSNERNLAYSVRGLALASFESSSSRVLLPGLIFKGVVALNNRGQFLPVKSPMSNLRKIKFVNQEFVTKVLISGYHYPNLESLRLYSMKNLNEVALNMVPILKSLKLKACSNLINVSGIFMDNLTEMNSLPGIKTERLQITRCPKGKLLPTTLTYLEVEGQNEWKAVPVLSELTKLETLIITECEELEELSVAGLSLRHTITIVRCEKLQNISGIEQLPGLKAIQISLCNNAAIRSTCECSNTRVPSENLIAIGNVAEGAELKLGPHLFSEWIAAEQVIQLEDRTALDLVETMADGGSLGAIIYCAVVGIDSERTKVILVWS
ncbi:hypothetical protein KI387_032952 [Taxus chinensis]|uniref:Disease resistance protein n=1 Tax=Taxus chinensis TaxID=29808 RepID=A0AA38F4M9_TAXCH|nr:hypothetical protein KI387_032952 [Taxus chinensis]